MAAPNRHRYHMHVRDEVKRAALRQLTEGGPQALSINAIAKDLGVSGPALYGYFAGRDELLTELALDAYHDLAKALRDAASRTRGRNAPDRLRAVARAYRGWGTAHPHRYGLLFAEIPSAALRRELERSARSHGIDADAAAALRAVQVWMRLHGFVSLEIGGNFASMELDPEKLFDAELERLSPQTTT